uniref:Uncharacterized protein n=1 Tax=Cacopsylla melanoneura TaxID=428564 RepID=A0A8D9FE97_9HEMI
MYASQMIRQSAAAVSKPSWQSRKNVNKQKPSDRFMISKKKRSSKSFAKKSVCRKDFRSDRDMADSPGKKAAHPAKQIRKGHCLTFKKNRHSDEELLAIHKSLDSTDNRTVITIGTSCDKSDTLGPNQRKSCSTEGNDGNGESKPIQESRNRIQVTTGNERPSVQRLSDGYSELETSATVQSDGYSE